MKKQAIVSLVLALIFLFSAFGVQAETDTDRMYGDIDGDNVIGVFDYILVKRHCLGTFKMGKLQSLSADVNEDDGIDALDYLMLKRHCLRDFEVKGAIVVAQLVADSQDAAVMKANTTELQSCVDRANANGGGTVYLPAGNFYFSYQRLNDREYNEFVCMPKDNVTVIGEGRDTVLYPVGRTQRGLDMFYFNEYADSDFTNPQYLINADFRDFDIDGINAVTASYTSAGKGFMINLFRDCDYDNIVVRNTDGTGFGIDCPINCTITNCEAYNCGKAATTNSVGASGFGIGTGYSEDESMIIDNCYAEGNMKFGFFFEHQGRFNSIEKPNKYLASKAEGYIVSNCTAKNNFIDFGGELAHDVTYKSCTVPADTTSSSPISFRNHSVRCYVEDMDVKARFTDVADPSLEYYDAVYWAVNAGITNGNTPTTFGTSSPCTIAHAITFLFRLAGYPNDLVLTGVKEATFYEDSLKWAIRMGMVTESTDVTQNCTTNDLCKFMWIYVGQPYASGSYVQHVNWAIKEGIVPGYPWGNVTRVDLATMFYSYFGR